MFDKFDTAFIDSLDLLLNTTWEEMVEVGLSPMKFREPLTWIDEYHKRQQQHLARENKAAKAMK